MKRQIKFDSTAAKLQGPIIDWCGGLRYTEICELELQETSTRTHSSMLAVDILLTNGSMYRLQRAIQRTSSNQPMDTIDNLLPSTIKSPPCISINFSQGKRPNLLFILSICYGIYKRDESMTVPAEGNFFALALVLNVARVCLPPRDLPNGAPKSSIELLWNEVFAVMEDYGHAFWADTMAEQAKTVMHGLIAKAAQGKISAYLAKKQNELDLDATSVAMSAMARVEALAELGEVYLFSAWDEAWGNYWRQLRSQSTRSPIALPRVIHFRKSSLKVPRLNLNTPVTGRQAGRLPSRAQLCTLELSKSSMVLVSMGLVGASWSREHYHYNTKGKQKETQSANHSVSRCLHTGGSSQTFDKYPAIINEEDDTGTAGQDSATLAYTWQGLNDRFVWMSAVDIAVEKAWDVAWPVAVEMGERAAKEVLEPQTRSRTMERTRTKISIKPSNSVKHRTSKHPAVSGVIACGELAARWLLKTTPKVKAFFHRSTPRQTPNRPPTKRNIKKHEKPQGKRKGVKTLQAILVRARSHSSGDAAITHSWIHTAREYEKLSRAEKEAALRRGRENIKRYRKRQASESEVATLAERAWGFTPWAQPGGHPNQVLDERVSSDWKEAWIKAWQVVWDQAWDTAAVKGVEFGVEKVLRNPQVKLGPIYEKLKSTDSYEKVETDLDGQGHPFSSLEQFYFMIKELNHLFESHQNATHTLHYDHLKITVLHSKEISSSFVSYAEKSKIPQIVSHLQLQNFIMDNCMHIPENSRDGAHEFRAGIREIWNFARSAYRDSHECSAEQHFCLPGAGCKGEALMSE